MTQSNSTNDVAELLELVNSLYAELEHRDRQLEAIRRISSALFPLASLDVLIRKALAVAIEVVDGDVGSVQLYDSPSESLVFRYVIGPDAAALIGQSSSIWQGINGRVFRNAVSHLVNDVNESHDFCPAIDQRTGYETKSLLTVPIKRTDGKPIGVMQVLNGHRPFDQRDLEILEVLCAEAALALENSLLAEKSKP